MKKFNFTRNSKTQKGKLKITRSITPDHEIYKLFTLAKELQYNDGIRLPDVKPEYIKKAALVLNEKLKEIREKQNAN